MTEYRSPELDALASDIADAMGLHPPGAPATIQRDSPLWVGAKAWWVVRGAYQVNTMYHLPEPPTEAGEDPLAVARWLRAQVCR